MVQMDNKLKSRLRDKLMSKPKEELVETILNKSAYDFHTALTEDCKNTEMDADLRKEIRLAMFNRLRDPEFLDNLLLYKNPCSNGSVYYQPTETTKKIFEGLVDDEFLSAFKVHLMEHLRKRFDAICKNVLLEAFAKGIANTSSLQGAINEAIYERMD